MTGGDSMDAISLDDWELLPDHESSFFVEEYSVDGKDQVMLSSNLVLMSMDYFPPGPASHPSPYGSASPPYPYDPAAHPSPYDWVLDEESREPPPPHPFQDASVQDPIVEFTDISVVEFTDIDVVEEGDEVMVEASSDLCDEEEGVKGDRAGMECVGFSVGKLRVNGVGALCSFGVAAATFCILLLGGKQHQQQHQHQHQKKIQGQKIQLQMYTDDERIRQVVEQASMLKQAVSSVMGGASTRASISFGGHYDGF